MKNICISFDTPEQVNLIKDVLHQIQTEAPRKISRGEAMNIVIQFYLANESPDQRSRELLKRFGEHQLAVQEIKIRKQMNRKLAKNVRLILQAIVKENKELNKRFDTTMDLVHFLLRHNVEAEEMLLQKFLKIGKKLKEI